MLQQFQKKDFLCMRRCLFTEPYLFVLVLLMLGAPGYGQSYDLRPWQKANINWRAYENTHLTVLAEKQRSFEIIRPHLHLFEALTGIKVGYLSVEEAAMRRLRDRDLATGGGVYDVVPFGIAFLGRAHQNHWLEPLLPYLTDASKTDAAWYNIDDFSANSLNLCTVDETLLTLPFDFTAPAFLYRKDWFERFGISVPATYEELVAMKVKLQRALDNAGIENSYAFATRTLRGAGLNTWTVIPVIRAYGGNILDDTLTPVYNSPEAIAALSVYRSMVVGFGNPPNSQYLSFHDIRELFQQGRLGSAILGSHFPHAIDTKELSPVWDKWAMATIPAGPKGKETSPGVWAFGINKHSKHKNAAWLFVQWVTSADTAMILNHGGFPARRSVWKTEAFASPAHTGLTNTVNWIFDHATPASIQAGMPEFPEVGELASNAFSQIFFGADIKQSLDRSVLEAKKVMQKRRLNNTVENLHD